MKIARPRKISNLYLSKVKSSTASENKKSTHFNKPSDIKGRVSITLSYAKDQCHQFISINGKDHNTLKLFSSKSSLHDLNLLHKSIYHKINEETKKITRAYSTSSLSNHELSPISKEAIRLNDTNSSSNESTIIS